MEGRFSFGGSFRHKTKVPRSRNSRPLSCDLSDFTSCFHDQGQQDPNSESPPPYEEAILDKEWEQSIGERVCISGVKHGILRYYGRTKFAEGLWCGVELDEPVGKNNGTVNGVQYFMAKPNHGIFAPVGKVSKVESNWAAELESFRSMYNSERNTLVKVPQSTLPDQMLLKQSSSDPSFVGQNASTEFSSGFGTSLGDKRSLTEQRELSRLVKKVKSNTVFYTFSENSGKYKALPSLPANCETTSSDSSSDDAVYSRTQGSTTHSTFNSTISSNLNNCGISSQPARKASYDTALQVGSKTTGIKQSLSFPRSVNFPSIDLDSESLPHFGDQKSAAANDPPTVLNKQHSTDYQNEIFPLNFFLAAEHRDDNDDDDQMSLDVDESLGILTPNQMKDFTISADPLNSCTELKTFTFPSSESFDDINDIPEDEEVRDITVEYVSKPNNTSESQKPCDAKSDVLEQTIKEKQLSSTDKFLYSYSSKVSNSDDERDSMNKLRSFNETFSSLEKKNEARDYDTGVSKAKCVTDSHGVDSIGNYQVPTISKLDIKPEPKSPKISYDAREITFLCEQSNSVYTSFETEANKTKFDKNSQSLRHLDEVSVRKYYDTDSSRDSLLQGDHDHTISKEKQLTVSWEDCIERDTDEMFTRVERPESVYTVGSNDTGYQEDGEFDAEIGMTTSTESNETGKRFSTISRDSCLASEDMDKVTESTSTSGYSTGLSDSYCNDRADDYMPKQATGDSFPGTEIRRSADDLFHCPQRISRPTHTEANGNHSISEKEFAENENTVYSETASISHDFTNDDIVSCLENTINVWTETSNEDTTIIEQVNGDLEEPVCPEKTPAADNEDHSFAKTGDVAEIEIQKEPTKVAPEADDTHKTVSEKTKSKSVHLSVQEVRTSEKTAEVHTTKSKRDEERRKQVTKSPRKNVMSKIKAMIEATSCKTMGRSKTTETSEHGEKKAATVHKKSRWEAVTSKIAASLAEEKTKPKTKREIKSKVNSNFTLVRQQRLCKSPRLDSARVSDAEAGSVSSVSSKGVRETKCSSAVAQKHEQQQPVEKSRGRSPRHITRLLSLVAGCAPVCRMMYVIHTPTGSGGKPCMSSRSTSPVAASESSTTVSLTSHNSKARIAVWKGSTSTIASSIPPPQVKAKPPSHPPSTKASINRNAAKATPKRNTAKKTLLNPPSVRKTVSPSRSTTQTSKDHLQKNTPAAKGL